MVLTAIKVLRYKPTKLGSAYNFRYAGGFTQQQVPQECAVRTSEPFSDRHTEADLFSPYDFRWQDLVHRCAQNRLAALASRQKFVRESCHDAGQHCIGVPLDDQLVFSGGEPGFCTANGA